MAQTQTTRKFDVTTATHEELVERINKLEQAIIRYREQNAILTDIAADYYWLEKLMANKTFSGNEKTVLFAARQAAAKREPREDGYVRVYREDLAEVAGVSEDTVGKTIKSLADHNIIERKIEYTRDKETNKNDKALLIHVPPKILHNPSTEQELKEDENGWGGKRVKLSVCCNAPVKPLERYSCTCCGSELMPSEVIEVSEEMLANEAALQEELKEIAAEKEAAAAAYPQEIMAMMDAQGIRRLDHRACLICQHKEWLPALKGDTWHYDCGYCHPFLLASQGRDLRKREGIA